MKALAIVLAVVAGAAVVVGALSFVSAARHTKRYRVPSASMEPTIKAGARVTVELDAYDDAPARRGDIVVFHPPAGAETDECGSRHVSARRACDRPAGSPLDVTFIKRIVAVGGDRLSLRDGFVYLDGKRVPEPYLAGPCRGSAPRGCDLPDEIVVPKGYFFMLGDTREASDDSRFWGPVPASAIVGRVRR